MGRGEIYLDPAFGVCDLIAPALPREVDYPASARGIAAAAEPVAFGETVGSTGRYPDFDYYPGVPPYLSLTAPYPPMAGLNSASSWRRNHGVMADAFRTDITCALQTGNGRAPVYTPVRPPLWQEGWEPAPAFRFDTGSCLRYFGSVLASRPVHPLQGTFTLEVTLGQASSFLLSVRRQGRLFHLPTGVRRHIAQLGVDLIAAKTGLAREFEALLAVHDAVNWAGVLALPPYRDPQAGASPLPRHSVRIRRTQPGEPNCHGWASTEAVADLGIPMVIHDPLQVLAPWFGNPIPAAVGRRPREWGSAGGEREVSRRRAEPRRGYDGAPSVGSYRASYQAPPAPVVAVSAPVAPMAAPVSPPAPVMHDGGPRLWYEGVDALVARAMREGLSVSWGDIPPGAALVGSARCFGGVLDRLQTALEDVEAGRSTLVQLCTEVTRVIDRREIADRWSTEVYALTREWPPSGSGSTH